MLTRQPTDHYSNRICLPLRRRGYLAWQMLRGRYHDEAIHWPDGNLVLTIDVPDAWAQ